ncbi:hypothetical protein ACQ4PT_031329 [Festuca glaucescens]
MLDFLVGRGFRQRGEDGQEPAAVEGADDPGGHNGVGGVPAYGGEAGDAVLLTDVNGLLSGIVTDKDIATRVIAEGLRVKQTIISKIMTRSPLYITADTLAIEALQKMVQGKFRHLPVVEDGEVIGMLDIAKCLYDAMSRLDKAAEQGSALAAAVEGVERQLGGNFSAPHTLIETLRERMFKPSLSTIITESTNSKDILMRVVAQNLSPELTLVEKVEGGPGAANDVANTIMQRFWDSALALEPPDEEFDSHSEISLVLPSEAGDGRSSIYPAVTGNSFAFKLEDQKGRSESLDELISSVTQRLGTHGEKNPIQLLYDDDEGDRVLLTTDSDLAGAVIHAKSSGLKVLRLHVDESDSNSEVTKQLPEQQPELVSSHTIQLTPVHYGLMAGAIALTGVVVLVYLKRSRG